MISWSPNKNSFDWASRYAIVLAIIGMCLTANFASGQNQITGIVPNNAAQGTIDLGITFTLDSDVPPPPPAGILPDSVTINGIAGQSVTHNEQHTVTAVFTIPMDEIPGEKDAAIVFTTPNGQLSFTMTDGFTVTGAGDRPATIVSHPQSRTLELGASVTFEVVAVGTAPLTYQWQKDEVDIAGATGTKLTLDDIMQTDAGVYRCVVNNDFGQTVSEGAILVVATIPASGYRIVGTAQNTCYNTSVAIAPPNEGDAFYGQDAQYAQNLPTYLLSDDTLTVRDQTTGLTWQRSPDTDRDGDIDADDKLIWAELQTYPATLNAENYGGFNDWRLPTIKELYSLIRFDGQDPSGCETEADCPGLIPFIDDEYFDFAYGDAGAGERVIDSQYASGTLYVSTLDGTLLFGVNFADGRIKGYGLNGPDGTSKTFLVICVRGNTDYGINGFVDHGNGTITDRATGLMWQTVDSGAGMTWQDALAYAEGATTAGYDDWRLPNVKELQSILDYTQSPDTTLSPAIDSRFDVTPIVNEEGNVDYPYYWSSTTHAGYPNHGSAGGYVAFGRGLGYMNSNWVDVHGAGCQRSDPKVGNPDDYPYGHGPQGDAIRIYNFVRCVRGCSGKMGDLNCNELIDGEDFTILFDAMAGPNETEIPASSAPYEFTRSDLNGDGDVDLADFARLQTLFGE